MASARLSLLPSWYDESIILVCAQDAIGLCRDGSHEALSWLRGYTLVEGLARHEAHRLRDFALSTRRPGMRSGSLDDKAVLALVRDGLKSGDLVALKVCDEAAAGQDDSEAAQRKVVRKIEAATQGRLDLAGQRYKLAAGSDLPKVPGRDSYAVVGQAAAQQILETFANREGTSPDVKGLFLEAQRLLAPEWRAPFSPDGLVLLRRLVAMASAGAPAEALTPSQMKKLLKHWIEIEVVDDKGRPYAGRYRLQTPSGAKEEGNFPKSGLWSNHDIDPGDCRLTLLSPEAGAAVWDDEDDAGEGWLSLRMVDSDGNPVTGPRYRIEFADGSSREDAWTDETLRLDGIPPGECQLTLSFESEEG